MTVQADHPAWVRACGDCERLIFDGDGRPTDTPRPPGCPPPCAVCPKLDGLADRRPLAAADDFDGLLAEVRGWVAEGRAAGFPPAADPFLRAAAAVVDTADEAARRRREARRAGEAVADVLVAANLLRRA